MVIYQGDNFAFDNIGGEYAQEEPVQLNMAKAPVSISISIERNKFVFEIEYRGDMYHEETIRYLADNLETQQVESLKDVSRQISGSCLKKKRR